MVIAGSWESSAYQVKSRCPAGFCCPNSTCASAVPWLSPLYPLNTIDGKSFWACWMSYGPSACITSAVRGLPSAATWSISDS